jgi:hypothetical protein
MNKTWLLFEADTRTLCVQPYQVTTTNTGIEVFWIFGSGGSMEKTSRIAMLDEPPEGMHPRCSSAGEVYYTGDVHGD